MHGDDLAKASDNFIETIEVINTQISTDQVYVTFAVTPVSLLY